MSQSKHQASYAKRWRHDKARGIRRYVDAGPSRERIQALRAKGASYRAIADVAGVSVHLVIKVATDQRHLRRVSAARILNVTPERLFARSGGEDFVPKVGAVRRLEALAWLGHSPTTIAAAMADHAVTAHTVRNLRNNPGRWISRINYDRVRRAYDALWNQPGCSNQTRAHARRLGFPPPLAWDDDTIDDPRATPQHEAEAEDATRHARPPIRVHLDDVDDLAGHGLTLAQVADRLSVTKSAVDARLRRSDQTERAGEIKRRLERNTIAAETPA